MVDLTTTYLGLKLKNPLVASAAQPISEKVETAKRLEDAGIAALVMYSLFEEQIIHESLELDHYLSTGEDFSREVTSYYPQTSEFTLSPDAYIDAVRKMKKALSIPVIGSLNGVSTGGWIKYARKIEDAGADALELNLYYLATDPTITASELEDSYVTLVGDICKSVKIPVAVKLSPFLSAIPNIAMRLAKAGAKGLVLFNRFYQPDIDLENLEVVPNLVLSNSNEMRLPLRWVAILYERVQADLAITSGVHTCEDVLKAMMAGANVAMMTSELLHNGFKRVPEILSEIENWMVEHDYSSIQQMRGSLSQRSVKEPAAFERANYMKILNSYKSLP
ncbi:MAG TPA: dihydroorotate dehydrogenase-like protein [Anaerolineales bacterium]|nr:dihydroorotate dehydrogenase-like protein [Anaerolineales bacterium]